MSRRSIKYYYGRINIIANYSNKLKYLLQGLSKGNVIFNSRHKWSFFEIESFSTDGLNIIHGFLVKYKPEKDELIVDPDQHILTTALINDSVIAMSRFFIEVHSGIIIFHPVSVNIEIEAFIENFTELFENAYENLFVNIDLQIIQERYHIFDEMKKLDKIEKIIISLHPSNPSTSRAWEAIDERMKKLKLDKYVEIYESKKDNNALNENDPEIESKITMAVDGYGEAKIEGYEKEHIRIISSKNNPIIEEAPGDDLSKDYVFDFLKRKLFSIFERLKL